MTSFFRSMLLVGLGGAVGSMARFGVSRLVHRFINTSFPIATFSINIIGSFLIGILFGLATKSMWMQQVGTPLLMAGICGGFTTFSAFALENVNLMDKGQSVTAFMYITASVVIGLLLCRAGILLTRG